METVSYVWPERPYKGLAYYLEEDAALFAGRSKDIERCANVLLDSNTSIMTLHGRTACGKSSFLRAGLLPQLKSLTPTFEILEDSSILKPLIVRSGAQPLGRLAGSIYDFIVEFRSKRKSILWAEQRNSSNDTFSKILSGTITRDDFCRRTSDKPEELHNYLADLVLHTGTLLLIIDQAEEILTSSHSSAEAKAADNYFQFLYLFCESLPIDAKICISLRSEYKSLFDDQLLEHGIGPFSLASYYLDELDEEGIVEAILHPTLAEDTRWGKARDKYHFEFAPGLPQEMAKSIIDASPDGGLLPTLQVICHRLYEYTSSRTRSQENWTIEKTDYLSLGSPKEQIISHVEESIYEALGVKHSKEDYQKALAYAELVESWLCGLSQFVHVEPDGRVTTRIFKRSELGGQGLDSSLSSPSIDAVLGYLSSEQEYVLLNIDATEDPLYVLRHDAVALVLTRWKREFDALQPKERMRKENTILAAASFQECDLYDADLIKEGSKPVKIATIDDGIWDHLLAIYANTKMFSRRLGIQFKVVKEFDRVIPPDDEQYADFLRQTPSDELPLSLVVLPPVLFKEVKRPKWQLIGICNIFRGYALIGRHYNEIWGKKVEDIARFISSGKRVAVFEKRCLEFYRLVGEVAGCPMPEATLVDDAGSDRLYELLATKKVDFIIGSAPTRARCEQMGFFAYIDIPKLQESAKGLEKKEQIGEIKQLPIHEVWAIQQLPSMPHHTVHEILLRLGSVLFYTVQYILNDPEDFVKFIYSRVRIMTPQGIIPIDRKWVSKAIADCYKFVTFEDYAYEYLLPSGGDSFMAALPEEIKRVDRISEVASVYEDLIELRAQCDQHLRQIRDLLLSGEYSPEVKTRTGKLLDIGRKHYQIYNFYDAERYIKKALALAEKACKS
jgi:hypothetical protein